MRITGGSARGRVLKAQVQAGVRPTSSRVREALFSMVGQDLRGEHVLDAFGGSGLLGLEAWSRGAQVTVVELRVPVAKVIRTSAAELGATIDVQIGDVLQIAPLLQGVTGVLADPPYALDPEPILASLGAVASDWLVFEADARRSAPAEAAMLHLDRTRVFGGSALWIYRRSDARSG